MAVYLSLFLLNDSVAVEVKLEQRVPPQFVRRLLDGYQPFEDHLLRPH